MKKFAAMLLALLMLVGLCACQDNTTTDGTPQESLPLAMEIFPGGRWSANIVRPANAEQAETLLVVTFTATEDSFYGYKTYYSEHAADEQVFGQLTHGGKTYYDLTFSGSMGGFSYEETANGNIHLEMMNETVLELVVVGADQLKVLSSNREDFIPVGTVFTLQAEQ